jgi:hypothetical protein
LKIKIRESNWENILSSFICNAHWQCNNNWVFNAVPLGWMMYMMCNSSMRILITWVSVWLSAFLDCKFIHKVWNATKITLCHHIVSINVINQVNTVPLGRALCCNMWIWCWCLRVWDKGSGQFQVPLTQLLNDMIFWHLTHGCILFLSKCVSITP